MHGLHNTGILVIYYKFSGLTLPGSKALSPSAMERHRDLISTNLWRTSRTPCDGSKLLNGSRPVGRKDIGFQDRDALEVVKAPNGIKMLD